MENCRSPLTCWRKPSSFEPVRPVTIKMQRRRVKCSEIALPVGKLRSLPVLHTLTGLLVGVTTTREDHIDAIRESKVVRRMDHLVKSRDTALSPRAVADGGERPLYHWHGILCQGRRWRDRRSESTGRAHKSVDRSRCKFGFLIRKNDSSRRRRIDDEIISLINHIVVVTSRQSFTMLMAPVASVRSSPVLERPL